MSIIWRYITSHISNIEGAMAWPHLQICVLRGIMRPDMAEGLTLFQEALNTYLNVVGDFPRLQWWHPNAPWLPKEE
jgi:hypothetical protein